MQLLRNALAKFGLRDELLCQSLLPPLLRRITDKTKWEDTTCIIGVSQTPLDHELSIALLCSGDAHVPRAIDRCTETLWFPHQELSWVEYSWVAGIYGYYHALQGLCSEKGPASST